MYHARWMQEVEWYKKVIGNHLELVKVELGLELHDAIDIDSLETRHQVDSLQKIRILVGLCVATDVKQQNGKWVVLDGSQLVQDIDFSSYHDCVPVGNKVAVFLHLDRLHCNCPAWLDVHGLEHATVGSSANSWQNLVILELWECLHLISNW